MFRVEQIEKAHEKVKTGVDFPMYIAEIKQIGVVAFETWVKDSHTKYWGSGGYVAQSQPKYNEITIASSSNKKQFTEYLKLHQQGKTDYMLFCHHCAETGIEKWVVQLDNMTCTYYDKSGNEVLVEAISA